MLLEVSDLREKWKPVACVIKYFFNDFLQMVEVFYGYYIKLGMYRKQRYKLPITLKPREMLSSFKCFFFLVLYQNVFKSYV